MGECKWEVGDGMDTEGDDEEVQTPESCMDEPLLPVVLAVPIPRPLAAAAAASCSMLLLLLEYDLWLASVAAELG